MCLQRRDKKYVEHLQPGQGLWNLPNKPETIKKKKKGAMTAAKLFVMCLQFMYTIPCTQKKFWNDIISNFKFQREKNKLFVHEIFICGISYNEEPLHDY